MENMKYLKEIKEKEVIDNNNVVRQRSLQE